MKLSLIITNTRRKSEIFLSNTFKMKTLDGLTKSVEDDEVDGVSVVVTKHGQYIRSLPNSTREDNIDSKSVTASDVLAFVNKTRNFNSTDAISKYYAEYTASVLESGEPFIATYDGYKAFSSQVRDLIKSHKKLFESAGKKFNVDQYLLVALVIDEVTRLFAFEALLDKSLLNLIGRNVSVGIAQIKLETANSLMAKGYYNPNPDDKKLPIKGVIANADRRYLFEYVVEPKHNINFQAALISEFIDTWSKHIDLSDRPEILATLYHLEYRKPRSNPESDERGNQIAVEFYELAKKLLE